MTELLHFQRAAKIFEQQFLCSLSFADLNGSFPENLLPALHTHSVCKEHKRNNADICARFERGELLRLLENSREPFLVKCPMECTEAVFPVFRENHLAGVLFAGPFGGETLPQVPENEETFFTYGMLLADMLGFLAKASAQNELELLLEINLSNPDFTLSSVAGKWEITLARASEKVKRITGETFVKLLRKKRIAMACRLLSQTFYPVEQIALKCGFQDVSYFYRIFRSVKKMTPETYRETFWIRNNS